MEKNVADNRLNVVAVSNTSDSIPPKKTVLTNSARKQELQAKFDRLWLEDPEQFNPLRNVKERNRLDRTMEAIKEFVDLSHVLAADLGCGAGALTRRLRDSGASLHAVDISSNALKLLKQQDMHNIEAFQDYLPATSLKDDAYGLVVCTDVIAYLPSNDYRILFAELSRLVSQDGFVACSTPLDINSEDALQRFAMLAETEFQVDKWVFSYHYLYIRLNDFFEAPSRFFKASKDAEYRKKELNERIALSHWWFKWNSLRIPALFWKLVSLISNPLAHALKQSPRMLTILEKISKFIWSDSGISHVLFIGKRRPLAIPPPPEGPPIERKHKKQVWE